MKYRLFLRLGAATLLSAVALIIFTWVMEGRHAITEKSYAKLKPGMSLQDIERILGGPSGDYGPGTGQLVHGYLSRIKGPSYIPLDAHEEAWLAKKKAVVVAFDSRGQAVRIAVAPVYRRFDSTTDRLLHMVRLKDPNPFPYGYLFRTRAIDNDPIE